ncbi:MAG: tetratricopeptide repeat protein [Dysgonamonadaceae bacterium]|nr:tetratricopeptide repeat protein [Dysgonamonadaceae bacterium]
MSLLLVLFLLAPLSAQRSVSFVHPDKLFSEAKIMYEEKNYAGCADKLLQYRNLSPNSELIGEADFLLAASQYYMGNGGALASLQEYLEKQPVNPHRDEVCYMLGSVWFNKNNYQQAIYWFAQAESANFSPEQQEDYCYRLGYAYLETGKESDARKLFSYLKDRSKRYKTPSTYYLAYLYYKDKDFNRALPLFSSLKDNSEYRPDVLYYLAQINYAQGRYAQAAKEGTALLNAYPDHQYTTEILRITGMSYYKESEYAKAAATLKQYAQRESASDAETMYALGLSCYFQNDYQGAVKYLSQNVPAENSFGQNTYIYLGQAYLKTGESDKATMAFRAASLMDFDPQAKEAALYNYAMLLHQNSVSAFGESVTTLENFLNTYPNSIYTDRVNNALVDVYMTTKDYDTALASIAKIKNPGYKILEARQKIYYYLGTVNFANADYNEAISNFSRSLNDGNYALAEKREAQFWRGESYYKLGNYATAKSDYNGYISQAGTGGNLYPLATYNAAYCDFNRQAYSEAEKGFQKFIATGGGQSVVRADAYSRLGDCLFARRSLSDAENAYQKAVQTDAATADYPLFQRAYVLGLQKNYNGKISLLNTIINDYPSSPYVPEAMFEKGRAYVMLENNASAIETYRLLQERFPDSENARKAGLQTGLLYFNDNRLQNSAEAYKKVISKYPGSEEAKVALQDLKSVYFEMNDVSGYADYVRTLGGAAQFDPSEQDSLTYLAAERLFNRNNREQAKTAMIKYLQSFPNGAFAVNAHYYLGRIYADDNNPLSAKNEFQKVLDSGNTQFTEGALTYLAQTYFAEGDYNQALTTYERLQKIATNKTDKNAASLGIIRSASRLDRQNTIVVAVNSLLKDGTPDQSATEEALYYRGKALLSLGERTLAEKDLQTVAKDTRTAFGAEAKYLLAQSYFDGKQMAKAKETVTDYIKQGTPHRYWMARSFILMSDIYAAEGDKLQARQYLQSLQSNYTETGDDIITMINNRLAKL